MSIKANELTNVTTLATTDRLIGVTPSSNEGKSITYPSIAALVLETYADSTLYGSAQSVQDAFAEILASTAAGNEVIAAHNRSRGGKYLGSSYTSDQKAMITAGTYDDLYVEDYWTINNVNWRIAGIAPFYRSGSTRVSNHICIVPDTVLVANSSSFPVYMNSTNTTEGGYAGSYMYTTVIPACDTLIEAAFGSDNVYEHYQYLSNAVSSGVPSGAAWTLVKSCLMNEHMVYGGSVNGANSGGNGIFNVGTGHSQLPLFALDAKYVNINANYWLRDVCSASYFAIVFSYGYASRSSASSTYGARPFFLLH